MLSGAMRSIADGKSERFDPIGGGDEIAGMAKALLVFRQAMEDVRACPRGGPGGGVGSTQAAGRAATQNFERAVNDIVQALDGASKSMDDRAHVMAETASNNKTQAVATATASEEATANVGNVAMAAEKGDRPIVED